MSEENRTESRIIMENNNNNNNGGSDKTKCEHHQNRPGQFGDTTETKIFVGGLPWSSKKESVENYFKQFGEILEAVVITDKHTGRSKGYGFVTFKDPESAIRACEDSSPIIDGRQANCNIAAIGAHQRSTNSPASRQGQGVRVPRRKSSPMTKTQDYVSSSPAHQQHLKNQQLFHYAPSPFFYYGYNGYSQNMYNNYYNAYYPSMGLSSPAALSTYYYQQQNQPKHGHYSPGTTSQIRQPPPQMLLQQQHSSSVVSSNGTVTEKMEEIGVRGVCERRQEDGETGSISSS